MNIYKLTCLLSLLLALIYAKGSFAAEDPDELYRKGRFDEAEKAYAKADMDHPKDIRYRYNRGCAAFQEGDYQGAAAAFSSVLRRTEDPRIRFRAAYNLGNSAFKQGDFSAAAAAYRQAIALNPDHGESQYNLELALRALEKLKKEKEDSKPPEQSGQQGEGGKGSKGANKDKKGQDKKGQENPGQNKKTQEKPGQDKEVKNKNDKEGELRDQEESTRKDKDTKAGAEPDTASPKEASEGGAGERDKDREPPKDLKGELTPLHQLKNQAGGETAEKADQSGIDRKKAEALLDNMKEDRSRFLRFQVPSDKKGGVSSGKDW